MGFLGDVGSFLGFNEPNIRSARSMLRPEEREFRGDLRETIRGIIEDPLEDEVVQGRRTALSEQIAGEQRRAREALTGELERRGLQRSGVAAEALADIDRQALQARQKGETQLASEAFARQLQGLGSGQGLSGQDINLAKGQAQAENRADQIQSQRLGRTASFIGRKVFNEGPVQDFVTGVGQSLGLVGG